MQSHNAHNAKSLLSTNTYSVLLPSSFLFQPTSEPNPLARVNPQSMCMQLSNVWQEFRLFMERREDMSIRNASGAAGRGNKIWIYGLFAWLFGPISRAPVDRTTQQSEHFYLMESRLRAKPQQKPRTRSLMSFTHFCAILINWLLAVPAIKTCMLKNSTWATNKSPIFLSFNMSVNMCACAFTLYGMNKKSDSRQSQNQQHFGSISLASVCGLNSVMAMGIFGTIVYYAAPSSQGPNRKCIPKDLAGCETD